jgi:hypothetical protein
MGKFIALGAAVVALAIAATSASAGNPNTLMLAVYTSCTARRSRSSG